MSFLHGFRYVHRNLKPSNFRVAEYEYKNNTVYQIKITDFRNSKNIDVDSENSNAKPDKWYSPEMAEKGVQLDQSIDVFVLGMFYFYVLFGGIHIFENEDFIGHNSDWSICENIKNPKYKIYEWTNKVNIKAQEAIVEQIPWKWETLESKYKEFWKDTAGYQEKNIANVITNALHLIFEMVKYVPAQRAELNKVTGHKFFKPDAESSYDIYNSSNVKYVGLCLIFCQSKFVNKVTNTLMNFICKLIYKYRFRV